MLIPEALKKKELIIKTSNNEYLLLLKSLINAVKAENVHLSAAAWRMKRDALISDYK